MLTSKLTALACGPSLYVNTQADHSQLIANTWLVYAIRGGFALVVPFGLSS